MARKKAPKRTPRPKPGPALSGRQVDSASTYELEVLADAFADLTEVADRIARDAFAAAETCGPADHARAGLLRLIAKRWAQDRDRWAQTAARATAARIQREL